MKQQRLPSRLFIYSVTTILGLSFTFILFLLAWFNSIDNEKKEFAFESVSISSLVNRGVSAADDVTSTFSNLLESLPEMTESSFESFSQSFIERHPFIASISFHQIQPQNNQSDENNSVLISCIFHAESGKKKGCQRNSGLQISEQMNNAVASAIDTGDVVPTPIIQVGDEQSAYVLLKSVTQTGILENNNQQTSGLVSIMVNPAELFGSSLSDALSVKLHSESEGITGRQLLFRKKIQNDESSKGWMITTLDEEVVVQFPYYSTKLTIQRPVYWADLDRQLILTALFLGSGITLLLIALARAKDIQARELRERNKEIERQVERQTRELATTRDQALEASRVKSEFLASMSHEIRTPLNAIIGMAELLSETSLSGEQNRYVGIFRKSGEALLSLVNDILDLSKIEAGQLVIERIDFNLPRLVEEATDIYSLKTDEKGIELICQVVSDVPAWAKGDPGRLRQIILNLLGNAIKFTESGEIVIRVRKAPDQDDPMLLQFSVTDTGIGIPASKLDSIFGSFNQVDSSTTRKYGGTGLGLTISKRLAEIMGGQMWVESHEGKGSEFHFTIRIEEGEFAEDFLPLDPPDLEGRRVLIIDDNDTNRLILRETLIPKGVVVTEAKDGQTGVNAYKAALQSGHPFDLVLSDCHMPGMDGFGVAEAIKRERGDIKTVLMLSSSNLNSDLEKAKACGIGTYLVKPVKSEELFQAVSGTLRVSLSSDNQYLNTIEQKSFIGCAPILLVEDNEDNRLLINAYLKKTTFEIEEAENGQVALDKFTQGEYSLVLMDVQMPVMDGHTATREMRRWEKENGREATPIIALTAHAVKEDMDKSIQAGCNSHLTKPIKKATLLQTIDRFMR